jgi:hypothetical protein
MFTARNSATYEVVRSPFRLSYQPPEPAFATCRLTLSVQRKASSRKDRLPWHMLRFLFSLSLYDLARTLIVDCRRSRCVVFMSVSSLSSHLPDWWYFLGLRYVLISAET